ncbi:MAG: 50S ribosomal protein L30 [Candidatus Mcinerneyibacterium aminivorans]|uniref:50S ribosomal protein L30 n=1 Tax=Candidatus Mcinerneyibacterium aminivorans TaxID=2703815 RepID=A0A5D0MHH3_9BACT|nr:MAG: 50S ribosomal protein L30 [Candidatus Mcinerneyibacterium aminivorans]
MAKLKVTLKKSTIGETERQKNTVRALGLKKVNKSNVLEDSKSIRGMISKVQHLVEVEEVK